MHLITLLFWMLLLGLSSSLSIVNAQDSEVNKEIYRFFDRMIGSTNLDIFKGVGYTDLYRTINDRNQFLDSSNFVSGNVRYDGEHYFDIQLNYDVYNDRLLVQHSALANTPIVMVATEKVSNFHISDRYFEHLNKKLPTGVKEGFFELVVERDGLQLYKKHTKKIFKRTDEQILYYEFKEGYFYLLKYQDVYYRFKKVKELGSIFPQKKRELKKLAKQHIALKKIDSDNYVKAILHGLSLGNNTLKTKVQ